MGEVIELKPKKPEVEQPATVGGGLDAALEHIRQHNPIGLVIVAIGSDFEAVDIAYGIGKDQNPLIVTILENAALRWKKR